MLLMSSPNYGTVYRFPQYFCIQTKGEGGHINFEICNSYIYIYFFKYNFINKLVKTTKHEI